MGIVEQNKNGNLGKVGFRMKSNAKTQLNISLNIPKQKWNGNCPLFLAVRQPSTTAVHLKYKERQR